MSMPVNSFSPAKEAGVSQNPLRVHLGADVAAGLKKLQQAIQNALGA